MVPIGTMVRTRVRTNITLSQKRLEIRASTIMVHVYHGMAYSSTMYGTVHTRLRTRLRTRLIN